MRKKEIKSLYHWTIMLMIMGMPLLLILLGAFRIGEPNLDLTSSLMVYLRSLSINSWYNDLSFTLFGSVSNSSLIYILISYPLYALWVVLIDLIFDCICVIPNIFHNMLEKLTKNKE